MPYVTGDRADPRCDRSRQREFRQRNASGLDRRGGRRRRAGAAWTAKLEYLYADFGTADRLFVRQPGAFPFNVSLKTNIVRLGVNYKF